MFVAFVLALHFMNARCDHLRWVVLVKRWGSDVSLSICGLVGVERPWLFLALPCRRLRLPIVYLLSRLLDEVTVAEKVLSISGVCLSMSVSHSLMVIYLDGFRRAQRGSYLPSVLTWHDDEWWNEMAWHEMKWMKWALACDVDLNSGLSWVFSVRKLASIRLMIRVSTWAKGAKEALTGAWRVDRDMSLPAVKTKGLHEETKGLFIRDEM